jgi:hypothetical protein
MYAKSALGLSSDAHGKGADVHAKILIWIPGGGFTADAYSHHGATTALAATDYSNVRVLLSIGSTKTLTIPSAAAILSRRTALPLKRNADRAGIRQQAQGVAFFGGRAVHGLHRADHARKHIALAGYSGLRPRA